MDESSMSQNRQIRRSRVLISGKLRTERGLLPVRVRNLSRKGALLDVEIPQELGSEVVLQRGETIAPARVVWTCGRRIGVQFVDPIEESELLVHLGEPRTGVDTPARPYRRPGLRQRRLTPLERYVGEAWFRSLNTPLGD